ncbi:MAG: ring-1,2-phenylacetyl-CoA epoxidase subunit PaaC [Cellvibrionaceae bacterium]|jgi:ring-1,2-phenylacetyl-CoA epoxidase subunit PaaC
MTNDQTEALIARLTAMADDELILAHRDSEWTGHAPILEEDIALANLAQDELGHATTIYGLLETLTGKSPDQFVFFRDAAGFRNIQLVELPKGDWAFTMLRQFLFDAYEHVLYNALMSSTYQPLADVVAKFRGEEMYHLRHSHLWVERLGLGTAESSGRMQAALDVIWPYTMQFFLTMPGDEVLVSMGIFPEPSTLKNEWQEIVLPHLKASNLSVSQNSTMLMAQRTAHTPYLTDLLTDMQQVTRLDPGAEW